MNQQSNSIPATSRRIAAPRPINMLGSGSGENRYDGAILSRLPRVIQFNWPVPTPP